MNRYFIRYPGYRTKALTLSYDDGVVQDARLMEIMDRFGIRGTFNLNGGYFSGEAPRSAHPHLSREQALALYRDSGHEVAVHGFLHPFLEQLPAGTAAWEIVRDREALEQMFGCIVRGCAYPMGTYSDDVVQTLRQCGIVYARTVRVTHSFALPADWLRLEATCRNRDPELLSLGQKFLDLKTNWAPKLFYLWGHSYEFDDDDNWDLIEAFCRQMGGHEDIWYATNLEIFEYLQAAQSLVSSIDGKMLRNPSAQTVYLEAGHEHVSLAPGQTLTLP